MVREDGTLKVNTHRLVFLVMCEIRYVRYVLYVLVYSVNVYLRK